MPKKPIMTPPESIPCIWHFSDRIKNRLLPNTFPSPFADSPHPLAVLASEQLQHKLTNPVPWAHDFYAVDGGKMFGVLVVEDPKNNVAFLAAFSGKLAGQWTLPDFVPPVFDESKLAVFLPVGEVEIDEFSKKINGLHASDEYRELKDALVLLESQYKQAYKKMKHQHQLKKADRHKKREVLLGPQVIDSDQQHVKLSFESQQDKRQMKALNKLYLEQKLAIRKNMDHFDHQINELKKARAQLSQKLHRRFFSHYRLMNALGEDALLASFFDDNRPPGGAGDCAAPKLLQHAVKHGLRPLALAEFWWGASPVEGVRHHQHYYPSCRGKCRPILPFMLKGQVVQADPSYGRDFPDDSAPHTLYEDDHLLVLNKPAGLLSVPGKEIEDSVYSRIKKRYPEASGPLLVHRLDLDTSGILLVAKNALTHKALQQQFIERTVMKRYVAILSKAILAGERGKCGVIELPLRVDYDDRPRQVVCSKHGKPAKTYWEIISQEKGQTRLYFYPHTGRTHQLRLHAAHPAGLNAAIVGDRLYGAESDRLYLHAERLTFVNPANNKKMAVVAPVPF